MAVNTKQVEGRRKLRFETLDDVLTEAESLSNREVKMLGNWSLGQVFRHLAVGMNSAIDGTTLKAPFFMRLMAGLFMKKKFIYGEIPSGFQIPASAEAQFLPPDDVETQAALGDLRAAIERLKVTEERAKHPVFGQLSREESDQFQMRHAEMHLSFAVPSEA